MDVTRWEYATVQPWFGNNNQTIVRFTHEQSEEFLASAQAVGGKDFDANKSGRTIVTWRQHKGLECLRLLGDWGWEMTGAMGAVRHEWYFKRPIQRYDYSRVGLVREA